MIGDILQPTHLLFILVVALLVLGPKRLPEAGRALGKGLRDFRSAISGEDDHQNAIATEAAAPPPAPAVAVAPSPEPTANVALQPPTTTAAVQPPTATAEPADAEPVEPVPPVS